MLMLRHIAKQTRRNHVTRFLFSTGKDPRPTSDDDGQKKEFNVEEWEAQMKNSHDSIQRKMQQIKEQADQSSEGEQFTHNPDDFSITKSRKTQLRQEVFDNTYFVNDKLPHQGLIYATNRDVYQTAEHVDTVMSVFTLYAASKVAQSAYLLAMGQPWFPFWTLGYSLLTWTSSKYLMSAYLNNLYLIDRIYLNSEDEIKV